MRLEKTRLHMPNEHSNESAKETEKLNVDNMHKKPHQILLKT